MRTRNLILLMLILVTPAIAQTDQTDKKATTEDGKTVILKTDGTWYYEKRNQADEYLKAGETIAEHCKKDWPEDFEMRAYCEKKQNKGLAQLKLDKPSDISEDQYRIIHKNCAKDWPFDFEMREYCEKKQFDAIRDLRDRKKP